MSDGFRRVIRELRLRAEHENDAGRVDFKPVEGLSGAEYACTAEHEDPAVAAALKWWHDYAEQLRARAEKAEAEAAALRRGFDLVASTPPDDLPSLLSPESFACTDDWLTWLAGGVVADEPEEVAP